MQCDDDVDDADGVARSLKEKFGERTIFGDHT
jgi:hypothetical protein